ncbi:hypothetical protein BDQ12DRAFT_726676 [Crucibulum laeve]|uniref:Uncharacterized protein n=1 Tax=Crucibulum laeve TaxID=68775 RepID=A0A5C3LPV6_9AGAR|nr:hypothetical protein BDQ12DRAFT_726676 [Crucibulum laeve]
MVSTTSASTQASESEKKRKVSTEKAKASLLSQQLQMRLQYARLKVEHGWQKQNLNEVENLYFRHSHQRGPKLPQITSSPNQCDTTPFNSTAPNPQTASSLSFRLSRNEGSLSSNEITLAVSSLNTDAHPQPTPITQHDPVIDPSLLPLSMEGLISMDAGRNEKPAGSEPADHATNTRTGLPSPPHEPNYSNNHYPSIKPTRNRLSRPQASGKGAPPLTAQDIHGFGTSSLTYDSFWSSHAGPTTLARSFRAPMDIMTGVSQLQNVYGHAAGANMGYPPSSAGSLYTAAGPFSTDASGRPQSVGVSSFAQGVQ